jgi:transcriptional regulator with XRE-family HTH domain
MANTSKDVTGEKQMRVLATRLRLLLDGKPNATQTQLSEAIGVSQQMVSQYIHGISEPGCNTLVKIADYFDVSLDYLLGRTETRTTDLTTQKVCEITGLNEHSIDLLNGINACTMGGKYIETPDLKEHSIDPSDGISACDTSYECSEIQRFGRNPDYAFCLVNEFIDFAFSPVNAFSIPYDHYLLFREQVEQNQISVQKWEQLSPDEKDKLIAET